MSRFLPIVALLLIWVFRPLVEAEPGSVLRLESPTTPFHQGDHLQIESGTAPNGETMVVTVLETALWPVALVRNESAPIPCEFWIDFTNIRGVKRVDDAIVIALRLLAESDD
jgi:hypothetical protein